jgi:hypothetical protein
MALIEDLVKMEGAGPLAIAVGAVVLAPAVLPAVGRILRPVVKGAIKTGITLYEETYASVKEATGDIIAEARSELESQAHQSEAAAESSRAQAT